MRVFLSLALATCVFAYDAVIFSSDQKIGEEYPTLDNIISSASAESPVVFIVNPDFTLGQFSLKAATYSNKEATGLPALVKSSQSYASRFLEEPTVTAATVVTSPEQFKTGSSIYVLAGEDWSSMEELAVKILPLLKNKFTGIITDTEATVEDQKRVKRVAIEDKPSNADTTTGVSFDMPLVLPPYNISPDATYDKLQQNCLLYMEGITIIVQNGQKFASVVVGRNDSTKWSYDSATSVNCQAGRNGSAGFTGFWVQMTTGSPITANYGLKDDVAFTIPTGTIFSFWLGITGDAPGYWQLAAVTLEHGFTIQKGDSQYFGMPGDATTQSGSNTSYVDGVGMNSVSGFAWACGMSQAVFFNTTGDSGLKVGIGFYNTQVQPYGILSITNQTYFTWNVDDCVPTFSTGSWMAIISIVVLLIGFFFGYLMLNAVQTMDRFDDPKQKQIIINVKE